MAVVQYGERNEEERKREGKGREEKREHLRNDAIPKRVMMKMSWGSWHAL